MNLMLPSARRKDGAKQPCIKIWKFDLRIPFVHYEWEIPEMIQACVVFMTGSAATAYLQDLFGFTFEMALSIVFVHELLYMVNNTLGDPLIGGWITPAVPLITAFLLNFEGIARMHALVGMELLLGLIYVILGATGIATKIMDNENLMLAMYDAPEEMMRFMEIVTGAIDDTIAAMERRVGKENLVKNASAPVPGGETGLILWDDYVSVLSPEMHEKFCRPFNMKLYDKYGYGHLHTCGPYFPGYLEACLACKPKSLDLSIMRGMSRSREDFLRFRERTREAGVILCGTPVVSEGSIFENKFIEPDEEFLTEMARGGILPGGGGSYEDGVRMTEMWKRISKRVL